MRKVMWGVIIGLGALVVLACAGPTTRYYEVEYELEQAGVDATKDKSAYRSLTFNRVMNRSKTVAFFPPDNCLDMRAAHSKSENVATLVHLVCGVLIAKLEAEATAAGFQVVSWQMLRSTAEKRPIDYAREHGVDLLFEVSELSINNSPQDTFTVGTLRFFEDFTDSTKTPLVVRDVEKVAKRCQNIVFKSLGEENIYAPSVTLAVKAVSVEDGQIHWYYIQSKAWESFIKEPRSYWFRSALEGQDPKDVICASTLSKPPIKEGVEQTVAEPEEGPAGSEWKFEKESEASESALQVIVDTLITDIIKQYIEELKAARSGVASPTSPAPAPAAPAPGGGKMKSSGELPDR